jgi:urate oxidase
LAGVSRDRQGLVLTAGIGDLLILKTTDSGFEGYIRDPYTTLKETADRILATSCHVQWTYAGVPEAPQDLYTGIREQLLRSFAGHKSLSVQHTLYAMGQAVLEGYPLVREITLKMPNKHHILFNFQPFGLENNNEIFIATEEPYGYITGTVVREG